MIEFNKTVLFACGGTGGHVFPAVAISEVMKSEYGCSVKFAGRAQSMESRILASADFIPIKAVPLKRGKVVENLLLPLKLLQSIYSGYSAVKKSKAEIVIGTGGYVSLPVVLGAALQGVPVYVQEQNSVAGIANSIAVKIAKKVFVPSESLVKTFGKEKSFVSGNPVRGLNSNMSSEKPAEFEKYSDRKSVLVLGGSQGAKGINEKLVESIEQIKNQKDFVLVWQVGENNLEKMREIIGETDVIVLKGFIDSVYSYMQHSDVIVSRAGASTLAEILVFGKPSILVPFPYATANHQEHNARDLEKSGAALVELESEENCLFEKINDVINDGGKSDSMKLAAKNMAKPNAAHVIASEIYKLESQI